LIVSFDSFLAQRIIIISEELLSLASLAFPVPHEVKGSFELFLGTGQKKRKPVYWSEAETLDRVIKLKDRKQAKNPNRKRIIKKKRRFVFIASLKLPIDNW